MGNDEALRRQIRTELVGKIASMGYPRNFGETIADNLHSVKTMSRMLGYLEHSHPGTAEEIADEMLAIMEDRKRWIEKKESERANARYSEYLNRRKDDEEN